MNIRLHEYKPSPSLNKFVHSFWSGDFNVFNEPDYRQAVVPNGYIELIIHVTDEHCSLEKQFDRWDCSPDYTLIGMYTKPYEVRFRKLVQVFGIRFYPEGLSNIFGVPPSQVASTFGDITDLLGESFRKYCHRIRECTTTEARIHKTETYLQGMLSKNYKEFDYIQIAASTIRKLNGLLSQDELMKRVPISPRQLQRQFRNQVGITPKEYMRIARLNAVQKYMHSVGKPDFGDITFDHGFSDQSHLIREFKNFTGRAPKSFLKDRAQFILNI